MVDADVIVAICALVVSILAGAAAFWSAVEARKVRRIESDRRRQERAADIRLRLEWQVGQPQRPEGPSPTFMYYAVYNRGMAPATDVRIKPTRALDGRPLPEDVGRAHYHLNRVDPGARSGFTIPIKRERDLLLRGRPTSSTHFEATLSWVDGNGDNEKLVTITEGQRYPVDAPPP